MTQKHKETETQEQLETVTTSVTIPRELHLRSRRNALEHGTTFQALAIRGLELANHEIEAAHDGRMISHGASGAARRVTGGGGV